MDLWNREEPVLEFGVDVPSWIERDITPCDVAAICEGGCASGAYMPAVTYSEAMQTMFELGDDVLAFIDDTLGEIPAMPETAPAYGTWGGQACYYLSVAVELWAASAETELLDIDDEGAE